MLMYLIVENTQIPVNGLYVKLGISIEHLLRFLLFAAAMHDTYFMLYYKWPRMALKSWKHLH